MSSDDTPVESNEPTATEGQHATRARRSRSRKQPEQPAEPPVEQHAAEAGGEAEHGQGEGPSRLDVALQKLARMKETNSICFRHKDDFGRIEQELAKFNYSDAEMEIIMEPKGPRGIPGFPFQQLERQKSYVRFLGGNPDGPGHAPG